MVIVNSNTVVIDSGAAIFSLVYSLHLQQMKNQLCKCNMLIVHTFIISFGLGWLLTRSLTLLSQSLSDN